MQRFYRSVDLSRPTPARPSTHRSTHPARRVQVFACGERKKGGKTRGAGVVVPLSGTGKPGGERRSCYFYIRVTAVYIPLDRLHRQGVESARAPTRPPARPPVRPRTRAVDPLPHCRCAIVRRPAAARANRGRSDGTIFLFER